MLENINDIEEELIESLTGLNKIEFIRFGNNITSLEDSKNRNKYQCLAIYLFWLRTGISQELVAKYFDSVKLNNKKVCKYLREAREAIHRDYVPLHLGPSHLNREQWLQKNSSIICRGLNLINENKTINEKQLVVIADGTYLRCEKSFNNKFQFDSYSGQKLCHLIKPFFVITANGYIIDIFGPYKATENDATIFDNILANENEFVDILQEDDVFILDRGFRDVVPWLYREYSFIPKLPTCKQIEQERDKQLNSKQANETRLITKLRFPIECVFGIINNCYKGISRTRNTMLPHIMVDLRIAGALYNNYHRRIISDADDKDLIITEMNKKSKSTTNDFKLFCKKINKNNFNNIKANELLDFPRLNITRKNDNKVNITNAWERVDGDWLYRNITLGNYQIKMARSYIADFKDENGHFNIMIHDEINTKIVAANIVSRHSNHINKNKTYNVYIRYTPHVNVNGNF